MTTADSTVGTLSAVDGLSVELADGVLSVTIDRPESLNSLTVTVLAGIADAMERAAIDPRVRAVRLGGTGRGFSSGASIGAKDESDGSKPGAPEGGPTDIVAEANRAVRAIVALPHPVVAAVQGPAAGVGVSLALACDLVLASDRALFMLAFTKIGLMPDGGASALVAAAVGRIRTMKMALLAERISAADALHWGLVSSVYPADTFEADVGAVMASLVAGPVVAFAQTKEAVNAATLAELDAALEREHRGQSALLKSRDFREGVQAFQERRVPRFSDV
jgi:enoyl-CoA hydratase